VIVVSVTPTVDAATAPAPLPLLVVEPCVVLDEHALNTVRAVAASALMIQRDLDDGATDRDLLGVLSALNVDPLLGLLVADCS